MYKKTTTITENCLIKKSLKKHYVQNLFNKNIAINNDSRINLLHNLPLNG